MCAHVCVCLAITCDSLQRAPVMATPAAAASTWSCSACQDDAVGVSASTAGTTRQAVTVTTAGRASIVTQAGL